MSAGRYTSRVFVAGEAIKTKLDAVTFTAHPVTGDRPVVEFSDEDPSDANETISVALNVEQTSADWRRISPPGRDEVITFDVVIRSLVPAGYTSAQVWNRLETLSGEVEGIVYDTSTEEIVGLGFTGEVVVGRVTGVRPYVVPTPDGWMGACVVTFQCQAQI